MAEFSDCEGETNKSKQLQKELSSKHISLPGKDNSAENIIPSESISGSSTSQMTKATTTKEKANRGNTAAKPVTKTTEREKYKDRVRDTEVIGKDKAGKTNMQHSRTKGHSGSVYTPAAQPSSPMSPEDHTQDAHKRNVEETDIAVVCTDMMSVWGLPLGLLLLSIAVIVAAVLLRPPGVQQVDVTNQDVSKELKDLRKQLTEVKNDMKDFKSKVEKTKTDEDREHSFKLGEIATTMNNINDMLSPSDPDDNLYPNIKTQVGRILGIIALSKKAIVDVEINHKVLKVEVDRLQSDQLLFNTTQQLINSTLSTNITNILESVINNIKAISTLVGRVSDVEEDVKDLKSKLTYIISKVEKFKTDMEEADDRIIEVRESAKTAKDTVAEAKEDLKTVQKHLFNKDALTLAILILFFLIIGLMVYVLKLKSSFEPSLAGGSTSRPLKGSREMEVVLRNMPSRPTLENAVCILSFDASNLDEYKRILNETVGQFEGVSFRTHVIRKHADIAELPHCRLYIMCVEFTERHVIIEEQGLGLGDLKLTSYRGVRKLGGALVILYIHDPGSKNLTYDKLYSDGVYCVKKQQELKELCEINRFISAHRKLNEAQKKALETAISNVLNIQAAM